MGGAIRVIENPYWKPVEDIEKVHKRRADVPNAPARATRMRNIDLTKKPKPPLSRVPPASEATKEQLRMYYYYFLFYSLINWAHYSFNWFMV